MSTRKIKNARDLESNELIYFKSHAQATFMSDGSTVEDVINEIKETGGADLTDYVTTTQLNTSLSGKQDTISDLADIRSGASKGATAVQPASIATAVTINGVNKTISSNKINIGTIPTAVTINGSTKTGSTIALGTVVTGVTMNGSTKTVSNGKVDLGTIITAHQTLKTINGESIIGSGDIEISGGGSSDANVQAIETGDVLDDVTVDYATKTYVDGLVGDINSILESIISGGANTQQENPISYGLPTRAAEWNYFYSLYPVESDITITADYYHPSKGDQTLICHISKGNTKIDETLTAAYEFTNVVITPESDSKYIYKFNG